jgi:hypothetical protein
MAEALKKQKDEGEKRRNPPTEKVPEGGVINPQDDPKLTPKDGPEGTVEQDAPVWEGGDPGDGIPTPTDPQTPDQTYWHEGEADQVNPGTPAHKSPAAEPHTADLTLPEKE